MRTHAHAHARTHARTHAHTHTHTHTHTYTHTGAPDGGQRTHRQSALPAAAAAAERTCTGGRLTGARR